MAQQKQQGSSGKRQRVRVPFFGAYSNRAASGLKDQRFVNAIPESKKVQQLDNTRMTIIKRPGLKFFANVGVQGEGRGFIYFRNNFFAIVGDGVYKITDVGVSTKIITLPSSTGPCGIIWCDSAKLGEYLFICDGTVGWVVNELFVPTQISNTGVTSIVLTNGGKDYTTAPTVTISGGGGTGATATCSVNGGVVTSIEITNPGTGYTSDPTVSFGGPGTGAAASAYRNGFPTPHRPSPTFIDGYVLLPGDGSELSGLLFNSAVDSPFDWPGNEFIAAEQFPDTITTLARQNNQVIAFGPTSTEFFFNAANVNASPLSRNDAATIQIGIAAPSLIYQNEKFCAFIGQSDSGGRAAWVIEGFQPKKISDEFIEKILDAEGDMSDTHGYGLRTLGHMLFLVNLKNQNRTLVYDFDEKIWHEWSSAIGSAVLNEFRCDHTADNNFGFVHMLDRINGNIYLLDVNYFQDDYQYTGPSVPYIPSYPITILLRTNKYDMDTYNRKFMSAIEIVGDRYDTDNYVSVRWSDDDYQTWSPTIQITLTDDFPSFARMGSFRRRAFEVAHILNQPLRLEALELTYDEGIS
jgi:Phage stabilisation protein